MTKNSDHAKHAFFYLIAFFALGFVATAIGQVIFQLINHTLVETTSSYSGDYLQSILRFAISALIISAPIYYLATRKINSDLAKGQLDPESGIRKWLTYIAIFIAVAVAVGDLITTLNSFLSGEITLKFSLKAATIFAIVGGFGAYYFFDLKRKNFARDLTIRTFGIAFLVVTAACLVIAFSLLDSPARARALREDDARIQDLQQISWAVTDLYNLNSTLPQNLDVLAADGKLDEDVLLDPVSGQQYEFTMIDSSNYTLCANFELATPDDDDYSDPAWQHVAGQACFAVSLSGIQKDYPIVNVKPIR
ncbi:MAG: DUF5671 domain-containing protein [Patescibacteria group bacterium]